MSPSLPERPDLEQLKNQAKSLLKSLRAGEPEALERGAAYGFAAPYRLAQAQTILAKELGLPSWAKLKHRVETEVTRSETFFRAVSGGDHETVRILLGEQPSLVRAANPKAFEAPPLNHAAERGDRKMIDLLLEHGADIDGTSSWWAGGFGPLDLADEKTSAYLLEKGATLTAHAAARLGKARELREILEKAPDAVHRRGGDGQFPLHFAKTAEIVDILVDAGASLDARDEDHVSTAIQWRIRDEEPRHRLLERGATPDIFTAVMEDDPDLLDLLLEKDPTAADRKTTDESDPLIPKAPGGPIYLYLIGSSQPYQVASEYGKKRAYALLYERASPAKRLAMAAWAGERETALQLKGELPNFVEELVPNDRMILNDAVWNMRYSTFKTLLELGWPVDTPDREGMTALYRAAFHGISDMVQALLPLGPDLERLNVYGGNVLGTCFYGSLHGWNRMANHARCVELLLQAGAPRPKRLSGSPAVLEVLKRWGLT